ncbi:MAG TPA: hypothetical protein VMI54_13660 [Polyangiaceae bacterium]|nr:hypothetical protein [Polyangiaceae bacterium]
MRLTLKLCVPGLLASAVLFSAASGFAQTPPPAEPAAPPAAPATAPAPATPEAAPAAAATTPPASAAPEAAPAAAPPAEVFPAAWTRIDADYLGLQLWAGATHPLSDTVGLATDIYLNAYIGGLTLGEFDIGPAITAGTFTITPMIGAQYDILNHRLNSLVPQFYITGGGGTPIYMELWVQNYENSLVNNSHGTNNLYFRYFIDYTLGKYLAIGPEIEMLLGLDTDGKLPNAYGADIGNVSKSGKPQTLASLPVGANINLANYGKGNNLMLFVGDETVKTPSHHHLAGRLTFIHNF